MNYVELRIHAMNIAVAASKEGNWSLDQVFEFALHVEKYLTTGKRPDMNAPAAQADQNGHALLPNEVN